MIYVFLANGFEMIEALAPVDILRRAGAEVKTVGVGSDTVVSSGNVPVKADITTAEVKLGSDTDMIVLPGGMPGTLNLEADSTVQAAIDFCAENDRYIGAICAAHSILGHTGLLNGRKATCFPGFEKDLTGAEHTGAPVEQDGRIITARGAGVCIEFGLKLAELAVSKQKAEHVKSSIQCAW